MVRSRPQIRDSTIHACSGASGNIVCRRAASACVDSAQSVRENFFVKRLGCAFAIVLMIASAEALGGQSTISPPPPAHETAAHYWKYWRPSPERCVEVGNFYLKKGDLRAAVSRFKQAVKTDSYYAPAYLGLGKAYERLNENEKALDAYEKYLAELPTSRAAARAKSVHKAIARLKREIARSANARKVTALQSK